MKAGAQAALAIVTAVMARAGPAAANDSDGDGVTLRLGWSGLDSGYDDWREAALHVEWRWPDIGGAYAVLRTLDRYGLGDRELMVGGSRRIGERWDLSAEASIGDDAEFVARQALMLAASHRFDGGWVGNASLRRTRYVDADVGIASGGVERYAGRWRAAMTVYAARQDGYDGTAWSQMLALDRYHGDDDRVGGFVAWGRQLDQVPGAGVESRAVPSFGLSGRQSLGRDWALDWTLVSERQGDLYRRLGASVGLRRRF